MSSSTDFENWRIAFAARNRNSPAVAATRYADVGLPVFPCVPRGKQPLTHNGFKDATTSPSRIRRWWGRTPEANVGIPTGAASGLMVVDVDVHPGGSGFETLDRARSAGLLDGVGWTVRTPSGGLHAYYPAAPGREQRSWQCPSAHIDFRGDGGYVIAPPSRLEVGGETVGYEVAFNSLREAQPIDAARLREFLDPPRRIPPRPPSRSMNVSDPAGLAAWVASRPEGDRNGGLFWAACRMVEGGHRFEMTLSILGNAALETGLPAREIESTVRSAYRAANRAVIASSPRPTQRVEEISL